jgi:hypothetical protein
MAGSLTISTLKDSSGVLATQNGMTGIAKAWVQYNAVTQTIAASFNVSSVTYTSSGFFTINFTTAMANANYSLVGTAGFRDATNNAEPSLLFIRRLNTAQYDVNGCAITTYFFGGATNCTYTNVAVYGA